MLSNNVEWVIHNQVKMSDICSGQVRFLCLIVSSTTFNFHLRIFYLLWNCIYIQFCCLLSQAACMGFLGGLPSIDQTCSPNLSHLEYRRAAVLKWLLLYLVYPRQPLPTIQERGLYSLSHIRKITLQIGLFDSRALLQDMNGALLQEPSASTDFTLVTPQQIGKVGKYVLVQVNGQQMGVYICEWYNMLGLCAPSVFHLMDHGTRNLLI